MPTVGCLPHMTPANAKAFLERILVKTTALDLEAVGG